MKLSDKKIKDFYEEIIKTKYKDNYEFNRWFISVEVRESYFMTYNTIYYFLKKIKFNSVFELGPGPGTWTRIPFRLNPKAKFELLDISEEMRKQFLLEMRNIPNLNYNLGDFLEYKPKKKYDLFFSIRAFEYLEDKEKAIKIIKNILNEKGKGFIITKKKSKNDSRFQHSGQISPQEFKILLKKNGFKNIKIYPVVFKIPYIISLFPIFIEKILYKKKFNKEIKNTKWFHESYLIIFEK